MKIQIPLKGILESFYQIFERKPRCYIPFKLTQATIAKLLVRYACFSHFCQFTKSNRAASNDMKLKRDLKPLNFIQTSLCTLKFRST